MQSQTDFKLPLAQGRKRKKPRRKVRIRYSNRIKCLLCYLICFSIPVLFQIASLRFLYPYKLMATAPNITQNLLAAFPFLKDLLAAAYEKSSIGSSTSPEAIRLALFYRDHIWQILVLASSGLAWLSTLILQLFWRATNARGVFASRMMTRAIHTYRLTQSIIWGINLFLACMLWLIGVRFIQGRTYWDYLVYFTAYVLNGLAAFICFRVAAPPVISGKRAFFKRL